ncbi:MAG: hypothetical protein ACRD2L_24385 [Terriglobia bacterium]
MPNSRRLRRANGIDTSIILEEFVPWKHSLRRNDGFWSEVARLTINHAEWRGFLRSLGQTEIDVAREMEHQDIEA